MYTTVDITIVLFFGFGLAYVSMIPVVVVGWLLVHAILKFCSALQVENNELRNSAANWAMRAQVLEQADNLKRDQDDNDEMEDEFRGG